MYIDPYYLILVVPTLILALWAQSAVQSTFSRFSKKMNARGITGAQAAQFLLRANNITEFFIAGADATACVKSTCYNMSKAGYTVHVLSDCITSYDKKKLSEMLEYYASKGCTVNKLSEVM